MTGSETASLLERIARIIPGIAGYQDREKGRDADKAVRMKAADEVAECRNLLSEAMDDLSRTGGPHNLRAIGGIERITTRLERVEDELRFAPSGYAGWFDRAGFSAEDIERLYEQDLYLLHSARALTACAREASGAVLDPGWTSGFEDALGDLRDAFNNRKKMMEGREAKSG